jgi:hypothetical protein
LPGVGFDANIFVGLILVEPALRYHDRGPAGGRPRGSLGPTRRRCFDQLKLRLPKGFH